MSHKFIISCNRVSLLETFLNFYCYTSIVHTELLWGFFYQLFFLVHFQQRIQLCCCFFFKMKLFENIFCLQYISIESPL